MPIRTDPSCSPGSRTHSCSVVYFRSSGYKASPPVGWAWGAPAVRLLRGAGLRVLGLGQLHDALDVERGELVHVDGGAVLLEEVAGAVREVDARGRERVRVADHVDH